MNSIWSALARQRFDTERTEFKSGVHPPHSKKLLLPLLTVLSLSTVGFAQDLMQQYEKAYYLETAKGQVKQAAALYQQIAEADASGTNEEAIRKSLLRLLEIGTKRQHEATIKDCHYNLLTKTDTTVQQLVELTEEGGTVFIPEGTHKGTIVLEKNLTLKGENRAGCILEAEADQPLIHVAKKQEALIESLALRSQRATSERTDPPGCALYVKDGKATLKNCAVVALGNTQRCPLGVYVQGFSEVQLLDSVFAGYAYPIFYDDGTEGLVQNCVVQDPGDCGFMSHAESEVTLENNLFTGSGKHGVRSTGGTIHLKNNLIIKNRNRGIYLGNKTTHGEIVDNAIIENGSGISTFASSDVEIENNVILNNGYAGIDTRYYGQIQVKKNIIAGNEKTGFAVFEEGSHKFNVGKNTFWNNGTPSIDYDLPSSTIEEDPAFRNPALGNFTPGNSNIESAGHGLTDPEIISTLWKKYSALQDAPINKPTIAVPETFSWQQNEPYAPPNAAFFPDNKAGGKALDALFKANDRDQRSDEEILQTVRLGFLRTRQYRSKVLSWIGNKYIWGEKKQHPYAIELMYHATALAGDRGNAIYFGLSVTHPKTPAILRTLAEQSMLKKSPADFGRIIWGARSQKKQLIPYLEPFQSSEDPEIRDRAEAYMSVIKGELDLGKWQREQAVEKATAAYADQLPQIKQTLLTGSSRERNEIMKQREPVLIMDDSFIDAYAACMKDSDPGVRNQAVRTVGGRWIWGTKNKNSDAIKLMLKMSKDESREVRYNSVYFGLSTINNMDEAVVRRLLEMAMEDREHNLYGRIAWGLKRSPETTEKILREIIRGKDKAQAQAAREIYQDMTGKAYEGVTK